MKLTDAQQDRVRQWAAAGDSLSTIQSNLTEEFGLRLSFMDVRLLVLELAVAIRDKRVATPPPKPTIPEGADEAVGEDEFPEEDLPAAAPGAPAPAGGSVRVEVSRLARPGFALCGDVTFSDGVHAQWGVTARGELSLSAADPTYRPTPEDVRAFQMKLRDAVSKGY